MNASALRGALIGVVAALVGILLVATGFLARVMTEPNATAPVAASATTADTSSQVDDADFGVLREIAEILGQDFVEADRADANVLRDGAIQGIFEALNDPHSTYIDPQSYALSRDDFEGAFQGIGATVQKEGDWVIIVRPLPDTPAERAGIVAGDQILEVDGESAEGWSVEEAVLHIRGPRGTTVDLKIRHADGAIETYTIERDDIPLASVTNVPPGGILRDADGGEVTDLAYIRISSFTRTTPKELSDAIKAAEDAGARGIILDLRSNPGGLLNETVEVADMFLESGEAIVFQVDRNGSERSAFASSGTVTDLPIVIVQDEFSASGSELLAAALQENGRAKVVGANSFGKGTVNHARELSNGGAVYVSIARWLTPLHNQIEGRGVIPDVEAKLTLEDIDADRDIPVIKAIDVLRSDLAATAPAGAAVATGTP